MPPEIVFGIAIAIAASVRDPSAEAAHPKRALLLLVAIVALVIVLLGKRDRPIRPSRTVLAALGALGLSALSMAWGSSQGAYVLATWGAGLGIAVAAAMRGRAFAMRTARVVGVTLGGISTMHAVVSFAQGARGSFVDGAHGNPNWLGLVSIATLPLAIDAARAWRDRRAFAIAIGSATLQAAALGLCHARVAWIAMAIAAVTMGWRKRRALALVLVSAFAIGATLGSGTAFRTKTIPRARVIVTASDPYEAPAQVAFAGRLAIARTSLRAIRPLGAGLGKFTEAFADAQGETLGAMTPKSAARAYVHATTAHDDYLHVAVESGPIAMLLVAIAMVGLVRARWRAGSAAALAIAIAALGDDALRTPGVVAVLGLLFAALPKGRVVMRGELRVLALAGGVLLGIVATRGWIAARLVSNGQLARAARIDPRNADAALRLGIARRSMSDLRRARAIEDDVATELAIAELAIESGELAAAEASARKAVGWSPGSARARIALGDVLQREGRFDEAEVEVRVAQSVAPGHPLVAELLDRIGEGRMDQN